MREEEKNKIPSSEDSNLSTDKQIPENNLNIKPVTDQGVNIIEQKPSKTEVVIDESSNTEAEIMENNTNDKVDDSISDLNDELSRLSKESENNIFVKKEIEIEKPQTPEISEQTLKVTEKDLPQSELQKELNSPQIDDQKIVETNSEIIKPEGKKEEIEQNQELEQVKTIRKNEEKMDNLLHSTKKEKTSKKKKEENPVAIRTYRDDLAKIIQKDKISLTDTIIAEENKKDKKFTKTFPKIKKSTKKKLYLSIFSLFLIITGITSIFLVYYFKPTPIIKIDNIEVKSHIFAEYQREVFIGNLNSVKLTKNIQTNLNKTNLPIGSLLHLYLTKRHQREGGLIGKGIINTQELFSILNSRASEELLRFLEPTFTYGYYSSSNNYPFLILKTRSFDNSFSKMLEWEKNLIEDLRPIFIEKNPSINSQELRTKNLEFKDLVINNKDVRAILDKSGKIIFVYAFADKNSIVITVNKSTLQEIFNRLTITYRER